MFLNKTNTVTELWQTTYNWLLLSGIQVNEKYCREEITTHPDYPALTSISDFLDAGSMAYNAVQADGSHINEFNYPVLAHIRQPGQEYLHLITDAKAWEFEKDITSHWSGIAIFAEKAACWQNDNNNIYEAASARNKRYSIALIIVGLCLFIISAFFTVELSLIVFGLLSLVGLVISVYLLGRELGYQSELVKQVCGAINKGGCENVLRSKYAKGLLGVTPADAALLYFGAQYIVYLTGSLFPLLLQGVFLLAFAGIAIAGWSIYTQAVKVRQWCALCIGIVGALLLQAATSSFCINTWLIVDVPVIPVVVFAFVAILLLIALLPIKQLIRTNNDNLQKLAELKKWKTDARLFLLLLEQEQLVDTTIWQHDLVIGDLAAPILITVACNPYCGPCASAHLQLDHLLHRFPGKIKIQMRLLCNSKDKNDRRTIAVKALLQNAVYKHSSALQQMLTDWFKWMDFKKWSAKWNTTNDDNLDEIILRHTHWIETNNVSFTPTFFINGRKFPGRYNLTDMEILLPQII